MPEAASQYARKISSTDKKRILRALEVWRLSGRKFSDLQKETQKAKFKPIFFGLTAERTIIYDRINKRVEKMLESGLLDEVRRLRKEGYTAEMNALNTVGYKEAFAYLDNRLSYDEMVERIKRNTRRYAKRQLTWFRRDTRIRWLSIDDISGLRQAGEIISTQIERNYALEP